MHSDEKWPTFPLALSFADAQMSVGIDEQRQRAGGGVPFYPNHM